MNAEPNADKPVSPSIEPASERGSATRPYQLDSFIYRPAWSRDLHTRKRAGVLDAEEATLP